MKQDYDKIFNDVFSEYFTKIRTDRGWSRKVVADKLGLPASTFTYYEKGLRDVPISVFKRMCLLYGLDFHKVFKQLDDECTKREMRYEEVQK